MSTELENKKKKEASSYVIGGCAVIGMGVGFLFFQVSVFIFLGSMFAGIGVGLVIASIMKCQSR